VKRIFVNLFKEQNANAVERDSPRCHIPKANVKSHLRPTKESFLYMISI
jgi:hypothetical protein